MCQKSPPRVPPEAFAPYQVTTVVGRHVIALVTTLVLHTLTGLGIVGIVARVLPVLQRGREQGSTFPPLIRECTGDLTSLITGIPHEHSMHGLAGGVFYRFCTIVAND